MVEATPTGGSRDAHFGILEPLLMEKQVGGASSPPTRGTRAPARSLHTHSYGILDGLSSQVDLVLYGHVHNAHVSYPVYNSKIITVSALARHPHSRSSGHAGYCYSHITAVGWASV